jgi:prepilin-type N-terminal cleavage/methylation domain-containing protein
VIPDRKHMIAQSLRPLLERIQRRLAEEKGFTLFELMIVLLTLGILMTVAVPTYLSFKDRAAQSASKQEVSQAIRAVQAYRADNFPGSPNDPDGDPTNSGYLGITIMRLAKYDATLAGTTPVIINPGGFLGNPTTDFCLTATIGRWVAAQHGPDTPIVLGTVFTASTCTVV